MKVKYTKREANLSTSWINPGGTNPLCGRIHCVDQSALWTYPLCGPIPNGRIRFVDQSRMDVSALRTNPEGTYPRRGPIPNGLIHCVDQSEWTYPLRGPIPNGRIHFADQSRRDVSALRTNPEGTYPLCGLIPKGRIRFADVSTSWTNPKGTYPLCGLIPKGLRYISLRTYCARDVNR
jgi:hypothetical protein